MLTFIPSCKKFQPSIFSENFFCADKLCGNVPRLLFIGPVPIHMVIVTTTWKLTTCLQSQDFVTIHFLDTKQELIRTTELCCSYGTGR